uniref:hypothetical protein n=1 Tax=Alloprevotella sp. TaxID=1872471 RepID=UPI004026A614
MTKKFTSVLLLLVSCVMSVLAQQVASTPTTWSKLTTGNYLVLVKSSKTSDAGNFMYRGSDDCAYVDKKSTGTDLIGSTLNTDQQKYIWKVTKSGNTVTLMSLENNYYINGNSKKADKATMGKDAQSYTVSDKDGSVVLSYYYGGVLGWGKYTTYLTTNGDGTNSDAYIGTSETDANAAQFVFYKTEEPTELTYNYVYEGTVRYSCKVKVYEGQAYPETTISESSLPTYVSFGQTHPQGTFNKATSETTFNFDLNVNLPFTTSTDEAPVYYYLVNGTDTRNRVYANGSSLAIRTDGQAAQLNDVRGDLWYVKGNPFDGFQFSSVGSGHLAKSYLTVSDLTELVISGGSTSTWYLYRIDDEAFGIYASGWNRVNVAWKYKGNNKIGFEKNLSTTDATKTFRLIPATITMPLNYSEADDKTFATTCLPYAVEVAEGQDNIKAYAAKLNDEKTELQMNAVTAVPANQGVILSGESASDNQVVLNVIASADAIDNDLLGTTSEISTEGILSLGRANGTGSVGFFRSTNATLKANRAYLKVDNETIQSLAMNFGGTTTGITNAIKNEVNPNAPIYDLSGRRVFTTVKGNIYLQQGRKFIAQ